MWSMVSNAAERSKRVRAVTEPFGHIEKNIVVNVKEGTSGRMVFSISRVEGSHKAGFFKVSLWLDCYYPFKYL